MKKRFRVSLLSLRSRLIQTMNDLDLSLPSRAYPSPSSSTYRRAGIFLAVHPLRNLARFIRLDLSRPCGIDS